jgi:hypothetical protein
VPVPPEPVTGVKFAAVFDVSDSDAMAVVAATGPLITSEKLAAAVSPFASVTVTV